MALYTKTSGHTQKGMIILIRILEKEFDFNKLILFRPDSFNPVVSRLKSWVIEIQHDIRLVSPG